MHTPLQMDPIPRVALASDNTAGLCPEAATALRLCLEQSAPAYGQDKWTKEAETAVAEFFEHSCEVFFVGNGTAANALAIATMARSFEAVLCHRESHLDRDECGAPEFFSGGTKLILLDGPEGRLDPESVRAGVHSGREVHYPRPRVLSVTQSTELGTVYTPESLGELASVAHAHGLKVHLDGARLANACAGLGRSPADLTWKAGVDVVSLGGTKAGISLGEAVVFFDPFLAESFAYRRKQAGQLLSKQWFWTAPWSSCLRDGTWLYHARNANARARELETGLRRLGVEVVLPVEANAVFVRLSQSEYHHLTERGWKFYLFMEKDIYRLMCSWSTQSSDVSDFLKDLAVVRPPS